MKIRAWEFIKDGLVVEGNVYERVEKNAKRGSSKRILSGIRNGWKCVARQKPKGNGVPIMEPTTQNFK